MRRIDTDILVIGAGGAGLRAALSAHDAAPDVRVTVISRGEPGSHGLTATACSDRMAFHVSFPFTAPGGEGAWRAHAYDIYVGGGHISNPALAELLARESAAAYQRLAELGVPFAHGSGGRPSQFVTDGSTVPRACYTGPHTAREIENATLNAALGAGIELIGGLSLAALLREGNTRRIVGALGIDEESQEWVGISARAVILASGGPGRIFAENLYPEGMDAACWWAALRAGASIVNIEFIQFGISSISTKLACSGSLLRALPRISGNGDRDLLADVRRIEPDADPIELLFKKGASWPVSTESPALPVDLAIRRATAKGETVRLDYLTNPDFVDADYLNMRMPEIIRTWYRDRGVMRVTNGSISRPLERLKQINPQVVEWFRERGVDLERESIEVCHAAQHFQGGVLINTRAETAVPGLYACGETAGGQHGANRPGGNSLLDCQVIGHVAGTQAASWASSVEPRQVNELAASAVRGLTAELSGEDGLDPGKALSAVAEILSSRLGVIRTPDGLSEAEGALEEMHQRGVNKGKGSWTDAISARAAQVVGLALARAAGSRRESRGSHIYFQSEDDVNPIARSEPDGRVWNAVTYRDGDTIVTARNIPTISEE